MARDDALKMAGAGLLALALIPALWPMSATAAPEERDAICQGYRGTALWGECTRAVDNGCHEGDFANLRCERWAQQWRARTGAEPPWLLRCGDAFGSKCVFVTSAGYTGSLVAEANSSLGTSFTDAQGLAAGDALCLYHAGSEGSLAAPGTYKAWLSDSTASPSTRFTKANVPYRLVDGSKIAADWDDLTDGELETGIDLDEARGSVPALEFVWTGTTVAGTGVSSEPSGYCYDWRDADPTLQPANYGITGTEDRAWTNIPNQFDVRCGEHALLYCFQQ